MPIKKCQNCNTENHVRRLACVKCGVAFQHKPNIKKENINRDIITGSWVHDTPKGMPKIEESQPVGNKQLTNEEIKVIISEEGIADAILICIDINNIIDEKLKNKWIEAKKILKDIIQTVYS